MKNLFINYFYLQIFIKLLNFFINVVIAIIVYKKKYSKELNVFILELLVLNIAIFIKYINLKIYKKIIINNYYKIN